MNADTRPLRAVLGAVAVRRDAALRPPSPVHAQIEPIGRCNLACRMCTVNHRPDVGQLSLADYDRLLDQMPGLRTLHLQGLGEPLLHPDFFEMVARATARGIRVSTNTNATLLTPTRARRCVTSGLAEMSISLDGARAATYEAVRVGASFDKVLRNVRRLVRAKADLRAANPELRLVLVLMRSNLYELPALVDLAADLGVPTILVQRLSNELTEPELPPNYIPIRDYVRSAELTGRDLAEAAEVFAVARERAAELNVRLHLPKLFVNGREGASPSSLRAAVSVQAVQPASPGGGRRAGAVLAPQEGGRPVDAEAKPCSWPFDSLYITASGDLLPCCMVATADRASFGNVFNDGLQRVWHGPTAVQWRRELRDGTPNSLCRGCALYRGAF